MSETQASKPPEPSVHEKPLTSEKHYLAMVQATINEKWIAPPVTVETPRGSQIPNCQIRRNFQYPGEPGFG